MTEEKAKKANLTSPDMNAERLAELRRIMPDLFNDEGQLDEQAVRQLAMPDQSGGIERYRFEWVGKQESKRRAFAPSRGTLVADKARSEDFENTQNLIIEGDNLEALKLLQSTYFEKIRFIYIDPPYNTTNDFIYPDDYTESKKAYWQRNGTVKEGVKLVANSEAAGRKHSNWLNMMQSRLLVARQLLRNDGVIFISIDDNEQSNLKKLCDEVFGEENLVSIVPRVAKRTSDKGTHFRPTKDYIVVYAKNRMDLPEFGVEKDRDAKDYKFKDDDGRAYKKSGASLYQPSLDSRPNQRYYIEAPDGSLIIPPGSIFPKEKTDGAKIKPKSNSDKVWRWSVDTYLENKDRLIFTKGSAKNPLLDENGKQSKWNIYPKVYLDEDMGATLHPEDVIYDYPNSQGTKELLQIDVPFSFSKPSGLIKYLIELTMASKDEIFLDFFAGSGTTAHSVMELNSEDGGSRKFILIQIPEFTEDKTDAYKSGYKTISDICIERVKRVGKQLQKKKSKKNIDLGFRVFKLAESHFPENLFKSDPDKSEAENLAALKKHLEAASQTSLFNQDDLSEIITEISLKNGYGLFFTLDHLDKEFPGNTVYRLTGNGKDTLLCLDAELKEETAEILASNHSDDQLILSKAALDTAKTWTLQNAFGDNLRVV